MSSKRFGWLVPALLLTTMSAKADDFFFKPRPFTEKHHVPTPTPEPASLVLLGSGLLLVARKMPRKKSA